MQEIHYAEDRAHPEKAIEVFTLLEQDLADTGGQLDERTEELDAARAGNRELTRALNQAR